MNKTFTHLGRKQHGSAMIEYATLLGLIGVTAIFSVDRLGVTVNSVFEDINSKFVSDVAEAPVMPPATGPVTGGAVMTTVDPSTCWTVPSDGTVDSSYDCFLVDATAGDDVNLSEVAGSAVVVVEGDSIPQPNNPGDIQRVIVSGPGPKTTLIFDPDPGTSDNYTLIEFLAGSNTDIIELPGLACSDVRIDDSSPPYVDVHLPDFNLIYSNGGLDAVHCGLDGGILVPGDDSGDNTGDGTGDPGDFGGIPGDPSGGPGDTEEPYDAGDPAHPDDNPAGSFNDYTWTYTNSAIDWTHAFDSNLDGQYLFDDEPYEKAPHSDFAFRQRETVFLDPEWEYEWCLAKWTEHSPGLYDHMIIGAGYACVDHNGTNPSKGVPLTIRNYQLRYVDNG